MHKSSTVTLNVAAAVALAREAELRADVRTLRSAIPIDQAENETHEELSRRLMTQFARHVAADPKSVPISLLHWIAECFTGFLAAHDADLNRAFGIPASPPTQGTRGRPRVSDRKRLNIVSNYTNVIDRYTKVDKIVDGVSCYSRDEDRLTAEQHREAQLAAWRAYHDYRKSHKPDDGWEHQFRKTIKPILEAADAYVSRGGRSRKN